MIGDLSESDPLERSLTADLVAFTLDGLEVEAPAGKSLLELCDGLGVYVPRLCSYPGLPPACTVSPGSDCGLCLVRVADRPGAGSKRPGADSEKPCADSGRIVHACMTQVAAGVDVRTDDTELRSARRERLAAILAGHPTVCLTCPDRDGCTRDECSYGNPAETRCCAEFARCELARLVAFVDPAGTLSTGHTAVWPSEASLEGRIRREPRLCVGCGRCVVVCETLPEAGRALVLAEGREGPAGARKVAAPREGTLRQSGCTFCGRCVMVCPTGALTAPGERGARWLADRRERSGLRPAILPPAKREELRPTALARVPASPGVFQLMDAQARVLRISGVADLRLAVTKALGEPSGESATSFVVELDPLYTQRESELLALYAQEHGELPPGNDLGDDLFE